MEYVGLLIVVLGNIRALVHNIILQMCGTCRAYHARRQRCVGILWMSENQVNHCSSICKLKTSKQRKHWIRPWRTSLWWDNFVNNTVVLDEWRENFRMSKESFMKLCDKVKPFLQKQSPNMRSAIDVEKQLAVTLYYLSDEGRYRKVANAFGIGKSTVWNCSKSLQMHFNHPWAWLN